MTKIKSFSVGNGDMFYINHVSDNFSIIDCYLPNDDTERKEKILADIKSVSKFKGITRFISTHPDQDHIRGLKELDNNINILNFYCVQNAAAKEDESDDFQHYCTLRDNEEKAFYLYKGCKRKWMNLEGEDDDNKFRGSAGINILWPILDNEFFKEELLQTNVEGSPNNISPILKYSLMDGATFLWMGDLETDFMENIINNVDFPKVNILFAPHHGRDSGKVPGKWLEQMNPDIIVIGEAPSINLNYYRDYYTITQNSAKDITYICNKGTVDIFVENENYSVNYLLNLYKKNTSDGFYLGTLLL